MRGRSGREVVEREGLEEKCEGLGECEGLEVECEGLGDCEGFEEECEWMQVECEGLGDCEGLDKGCKPFEGENNLLKRNVESVRRVREVKWSLRVEVSSYRKVVRGEEI